ncbi:MAG: 4,5-DOPA dioxygenase extradiol [Hyphomonadaceae bacterium]
MNARAPAVFFGHGSPMNALGGPCVEEWRALGARLPRPRAILMVSAHWFVPETAVTAMTRPRTIHDFYGFPQPLYEIAYPAPGDAALARRVQDLLAPLPVRADAEWGLDHGAWAVLMHVYPEADIPVVQLSIDARQAGAFHFALGQRLKPLRDESVMIAGSGDIVHNLRMMNRAGGAAYDWAERFNDFVKDKIAARDFAPLIAFETLGEDAARAIPTAEHFLPLLYVLGAMDEAERAAFFTDQIELGSVSMTGFVAGA